ncbi:MAG: peptidoglycan-binding protein [Verrucomicrobiota bacterium]|nr:peptidoglycan-binding protein [Verrucomicrobiota bacterium]MDQ2925317.1 peptidoglycan-binding protein [Acidobacteriota bacterium]
MKKFTSLLIGCSLILAGAAIAQQPEEQPTPAEKQGVEKGKGHAREAKPEAPAKALEAAPVNAHGAKHEHALKEPKIEPNAVVKPTAPAMEQHKHAADAPKAAATPKVAASAAPAMTPVARASASVAPSASKSVAPATAVAAKATPAATTSTVAMATPKPNTAAATKKPDVQKVQQIRTEHANFIAQPNLKVAPAVTFNASYRVEGSDRWQGPQYEVYRSYRPERHDEGYYRSHYSRVELISGGYYYENNNYWYPAWGYNSSNEYYAYDGPIYVGHRGERPDRVIADVQASLKDMGYYTGSVDGLLGPLTRKALIGYQDDAGLTATATIDEPTLDSLNMGS